MKTENVTETLVEGKQYNFIANDGQLRTGTFYSCEHCGKPSYVNGAKIKGANFIVKVQTAMKGAMELGFNEISNKSVCEKCEMEIPMDEEE